MSVEREADDEVLLGLFPVHRACRDGDVGALLSLVPSHRAHLSIEDPGHGWTPVHWAAHRGQLECVAHLVRMGCAVNAATSRFNQTPTHIAAFGGHPRCVLWLAQAGADVNRQDFVGEAPIHKAAQSGSLECIQVLLSAGAEPHLRNARGQTAADLAHARGFHDCSSLISKAQPGGLRVDRVQNGNGAPCGHDPLGRKRLLTAAYSGHMKRARRADNPLVQLRSSGGEELESVNMESTEELNSDATTNGHHLTPPKSPASPSSHPANQQTAAPTQHSFTDMCGSLHLSGSPGSCVSHRPTCWGQMGADPEQFLLYGHYHGFGDTAEELSDSSRRDYSSGVQAEHSSMDRGFTFTASVLDSGEDYS